MPRRVAESSVVQIISDRKIVRCPERPEHQQHLVDLDQLPGLFERRRGVGTVIVRDEFDLAAIDAAIIVDPVEIGRLGFSNYPERGQWAGVGHDVSDTDLGIAHAAVRNQIGVGKSWPKNDRHDQRYRTFGGAEPAHWSISIRTDINVEQGCDPASGMSRLFSSRPSVPFPGNKGYVLLFLYACTRLALLWQIFAIVG